MSTFPILHGLYQHGLYQHKEKSSLSDLFNAWRVDLFLKTEGVLPARVAARIARSRTLKDPYTGSVSR
jgi:hypothetical protein